MKVDRSLRAANIIGNILSKLHLANRTQAALYALSEGLAGPGKEQGGRVR